MRAKYMGGKEPRPPKEISEVIGAIIEKTAVGVDLRQGQLVADWESVVPADWARFGTPIGVRNLTLLVEVPDGSAATLLKYQYNDLLRAIRAEYGDDLVSSVKVKVSPP